MLAKGCRENGANIFKEIMVQSSVFFFIVYALTGEYENRHKKEMTRNLDFYHSKPRHIFLHFVQLSNLNKNW